MIFDLDGTLADTLDGIVHAVNLGLAELELPQRSRENIRDNMGMGLRNLCRWATAEAGEEIGSLLARSVMRHQQELWRRYMRVFPGIRELLDGLKAQGWALAVFSNKLEFFVSILCRETFGAGTFDAIGGVSEQSPPKPSPAGLLRILQDLGADPAQSFMVGDMWVDVAAGNAAGLRTIGVTWGYHGEHGFREHKPWKVARTPEEILEIVTKD